MMAETKQGQMLILWPTEAQTDCHIIAIISHEKFRLGGKISQASCLLEIVFL